ncbi:RDD family protein [Streptomyces sp. NPDC051218]|uniref:RDD family protein n=1 Tax=Streptomyces sp. NPDC051218 TaxID=3365645 RepID=UPI0037967694
MTNAYSAPPPTTAPYSAPPRPSAPHTAPPTASRPSTGSPSTGSPSTSRPSTGRRALAWAVDFALVLALAFLLGALAVQRITEVLTDLPDLAGQGAWQLLTADGDTLDRAQGLGRQMWREAVLIVIQSCALLVVATFLYHFAALAIAGRTLGKKMLGLRITPRRPRTSALRAAASTTADVGCFALACSLLTSGAFLAAFAAWLLALVVFWANALPALSSSGRSLADRLAGTSVVRGPENTP